MLNKEVASILDQYNNEDGIACLIAASLIRYYSVNGISHDQFQDDYQNYLRMIFSGRRFRFLDKEKLLSCKDQILSTVMAAVCEDLTDAAGSDEVYLSLKWQPEALEAVLVELFDNRQILSIISR
ncbi:hypothetical protein ACU6ZE_00460 [Klebsiella aerogenes]